MYYPRKLMTVIMTSLLAITLFSGPATAFAQSQDNETAPAASRGPLDMRDSKILTLPQDYPPKFTHNDGVDIPYPEDGVKGIYVAGHNAMGESMDELTQFVNETDLNTMVIDVKDDWGNILWDLASDHELIKENTVSDLKIEDLIGHMEEHQIYPIARVVVFKDTLLSESRPDLSFTTDDGEVWKAGSEGFVSPFKKEVWDYSVEIAKEAAMRGFKEIQFDYVRFPEGFETFGDDLNYDMEDYDQNGSDPVQQRVAAVSDFVEYASQELKPYGVDVSVDIFGYTATIEEAPGIGQNFSQIAENVDIISSMIYPSHWGPGSFNLDYPDTYPYELTNRYLEKEKEVMGQLDNPPISRPWLQDFTASYLAPGSWIEYGPKEVQDQVQALYNHDIHEFLLWNASNEYTKGVDYTPDEKVDPTEGDPQAEEDSSNFIDDLS